MLVFGFLPFIPLVILASGALGLGGFLLASLSEPNEETRDIIILGMQGSGKTTLWEALGAKVRAGATYSEEAIDSFSIEVIREGETHRISIHNAKDVGGAKDFVSYKHYLDLINSDSFVYFIVNAMHIRKSDYYEDIEDRLLLINKIVKEKGTEKLGLKILVSHCDHISGNDEKEHIYGKIKEIFKEVGFKDKFPKIEFVNLTDSNDIKWIKNEICNPK